MIIIYTSDAVLRKNAFEALKRVRVLYIIVPQSSNNNMFDCLNVIFYQVRIFSIYRYLLTRYKYQVLADIPNSQRFDILKALITNSVSSSMVKSSLHLLLSDVIIVEDNLTKVVPAIYVGCNSPRSC